MKRVSWTYSHTSCPCRRTVLCRTECMSLLSWTAAIQLPCITSVYTDTHCNIYEQAYDVVLSDCLHLGLVVSSLFGFLIYQDTTFRICRYPDCFNVSFCRLLTISCGHTLQFESVELSIEVFLDYVVMTFEGDFKVFLTVRASFAKLAIYNV